jgi:hypothetical protein
VPPVETGSESWLAAWKSWSTRLWRSRGTSSVSAGS